MALKGMQPGSLSVVRVYIAAPYPLRRNAVALMKALEDAGIVVTSRWLKENDTLADEHACNDLDDVARADLLVALNPPEWAEKGTGGRHVELGYALALHKWILLVGPRTNMFHYLSSIMQVDGEPIVLHVQSLARKLGWQR